MKIFISALFLTIAVFLLFGELNASELQRTGLSEDTPTLVYNPPAGPETEGPAHRAIPYGNYTINLWLDATQRRVVKADFQDNYAPTPRYIASHDFFVKLIDVGGFKIVGYFRTDGLTLFGIRAPNPNARPNDLEPSRSTWFIVYYGRAFKVTVNRTGRATQISLVPRNERLTDENQLGRRSTWVFIGGVHFIIFYWPNGILGATLHPDHNQL